MKKKFDRSLSLFLALVMCLSLMPVSALAEEYDTEQPVHEHWYEAVVTAPTCTEPGYTTYTCSCGDSYVDDYVDATGHNPVAVAEVPPTETGPGTAAGIVCSECGEVLEGCGEIPALTAAEDAEDEALPDENGAFASAGTCGTNVSWTLDDSGTLTISGTGTMTNYSASSNPQWYSEREDIVNVVVDEGVTSIGEYAFYDCTSLESVSVSSTVKTVGSYAFNGCSSLETVTLPPEMTKLGCYAFKDTGITEITIPKTLTTAVTSNNCGPLAGSSIAKVAFENGMAKIPNYMLAYAESLADVVIP